nr:hypothetical protein MarFTME_039 [Marseillevirus futianmevirus]
MGDEKCRNVIFYYISERSEFLSKRNCSHKKYL